EVDAVRSRGAEVRLYGDTYADAYEEAQRVRRKRGLVFVHPYDDPEVIAGQGTIGMEIARQHPGQLDAIFVPIGGGGLISGIAAYMKRVRPSVRIIGVEPVDAGALSVAGAKAWVERQKGKRRPHGKTLVAVASGANTNFDRLRFIAEEAELGEHREAVLAVTIPERPGSFKKFCATLGGSNITE